MYINDNYKNLYDKLGKRIGWGFSHLKTTEKVESTRFKSLCWSN